MVKRSAWSWLVLLNLTLNCSIVNADLKDQKPTVNPVVARQGRYVVRQLVVTEFEKLHPDRKLYAYYLAKSIEASQDIYWSQSSRAGIDIRNLLTAMWRHRDLLDPRDLSDFSEYFFKVLLNHGNYDAQSMKAIVPENISVLRFKSMVDRIFSGMRNKGVTVSSTYIGSVMDITQVYWRLQIDIFAHLYRNNYLASPSEGDRILNSNTNFYGRNVSESDLHTLSQVDRESSLAYPYRSGSNVFVRYPRIGEMYNRELLLADFYLEKAEQYAYPEERLRIDLLRKAFRSGEQKDYEKANIQWLSYRPRDIDFVLGFVENYMDPMGIKGAWEGWVALVNSHPEDVERAENIQIHARYFENNLPVNSAFKKTGLFVPPLATTNELLMSAGATGYRPFGGVNLPNEKHLQDQFGSKSFSNLNVLYDRNSEESIRLDKPFYAPKYTNWLHEVDSNLVFKVIVDFHENLGHASGKVVEPNSVVNLGEYYNAVEEGRADSIALYNLLDPNIRSLGLLPSRYSHEDVLRIQELAVIQILTDHIKGYRYLPSENSEQRKIEIRDAHDWSHQVMMNYLLEQGAITVRVSPQGIPQFEIQDLAHVRQALGSLISWLQYFVSTGEVTSAKNFFDQYGEFLPEHDKWKKSVQEITRSQNRALYTVFLNPRLHLKTDSTGHAQVEIEQIKPASHALNAFIDYYVDELDKRSLESETVLEKINSNKVRCESLF